MANKENIADMPAHTLGYIKYVGPSVKEGFMDARMTAEALLGLDESIRYYLRMTGIQSDYELPIRIQKGSIIAVIGEAIKWSVGVGVPAYVTTSAVKMAQNDFSDVGLRDLVKRAITKIQGAIKIAKHTGISIGGSLNGLRWTSNNEIVRIPNERGEYLDAPRSDLQAFLESPKKIVSRMASVVGNGRILKIGISDEGQLREIEIDERSKPLFYVDVDDEELFPELVEGALVELEGRVTRENERASSLGLEYKGHILTCHPDDRQIRKYKKFLFLKCRVKGTITRSYAGSENERKPRIIVHGITALESEADQQELL